MSIVKQLVCDFPGCTSVKSDLVWWESSVVDELPWKKTTDGRHWCPSHPKEAIQTVLDSEDDHE